MQTRYLLEKKNIFYDEDRKKYFLKTNENGKVTIAETEDPTNKDKDNKNIFTLPEPEYKEWLQDIRSKQYTYNKEEKTYLPNAYVAQEVLENGYIKATLNNKEVWVKDKILSTVWPDHGLQGTNQVQLLGDQEFKDIVKSQFDGIVIKGLDPRYEEYSAGGFGTQKFIDSKFIDRKIEEPKRIFIAGLATNICVFNTAKELHAKYPKSEICIVDDASKGVYSEKDGLRKKDYESQYRDAGIKIVTTKEALRITNGEDNTKTTSTKKKTSLEIITSYGEQNSILDVKTSNNTYGSRYHQARHIAQDIFGQEVTTRQIKAFTPNILAAQKAKLRGVSK
jgi:nicotinamidase-related amidase